MADMEDLKKVGKDLLEKGKELGGKAVEQGGKALNTAKINAEILAIKNEIKKSKEKLGDIVYVAEINTGNEEIEKLKKQIKGYLDEIKYLESKKSK